MRFSKLTLAISALIALPLLAFAQADTTTDTTVTGSGTTDYSGTYAYAKDGVFGCNLNGAYSMSVGALSATGGAYVPVNDAAVTLNTGFLVYKECVLRGIVDRQREGVTSALQKQILNIYLTGNDGKPYFSQSIAIESKNIYDKSVVNDLSQGALGSVNPAFKGPITRAIAQRYSQIRSDSSAALACSYGDLTNALSGKPTGSIWDALRAYMNPACTPYAAYTMSNNLVMENAASKWNDQLTQLNWYNGVYGRQTVDANGNTITVTPGSIVDSSAQQVLQTGFRQLENANDIDQMVGALFAGITSQVVGDSRGLVGLTQKTGSQASYLDQVAKESAANIRNSALNAAITILGANRQVEAAYLAAMQAIAQVLTNTISSLRTKENTCWNALIQQVCVPGTLKSDKTCTAVSQSCTTDTQGNQTCPPAVTLQIATSTVFSQAIVSGQITPLASSTVININSSTAALALINQLLAGVTNTTSLDAQRIALQQLDTLVAQHKLHTQYDQQAALQSKTDVTNSMSTLVTDTVANWTGAGSDGAANASWDGTTYPAVGWCNVGNQTTIQAWIQKWKK